MKEIIINIDNYNENSIKTTEGDNLNEVYKIYILKNKRRINLTNKIAVMAYVDSYGDKRSNILALNITNANEGEIELPITNIISEHNGKFACQIAIYGENNSLEQTAPFSLIVENNIFSKISNTAINSTDFHILSEAIKTTNSYAEKLKEGTENIELQYADKLNEVNSQLSDIIKHRGYITYEDFGAIGDGITNDGLAIRMAHNKANELKQKIFCPQNKTYLIDNEEDIEIKNSVDWNNCKIKIKNGNKTKGTFKISSYIEPTILNNISTTINRFTKKITELNGYGNAFIIIKNDNNKVYIREGVNKNQGTEQFDMNIINNNGELLYPVMWDFEEVTSITIYPLLETITIENCNIDVYPDNLTDYVYTSRGIDCCRNNVIINNINEKVINDSNKTRPCNGFIYIKNCANIEIKNTTLQPRLTIFDKNIPFGTYSIGNIFVINLTFDNVNSFTFDNNYWGCHGGNATRNLIVKNSRLSRIDSHIGTYNITIENSVIGNGGCTIGGFGDLIIKNVEVFKPILVEFRGDYGGSWNGDIFIENIKHYNGNRILYSKNNMTWNYNIGEHYLGKNKIIINNYSFINEDVEENIKALDTYVIGDENLEQHKLFLAKEIEFKNIHVNNGGISALLSLDFKHTKAKNEYSYKILITKDNYEKSLINSNIKCYISNVDFFKKPNDWNASHHLFEIRRNIYGQVATDDYISDKNNLCIEFFIDNCDEILPSIYGYPFIVNIKNATVRGVIGSNGGARGVYIFKDVAFVPQKTDGVVAIKTNKLNTVCENVSFLNTPDNYIDSLSKCMELYEILGGYENIRSVPSFSCSTNINFGFDFLNFCPQILNQNKFFPKQLCGENYPCFIGDRNMMDSVKPYFKNGDKFINTTDFKEYTFFNSSFYDNNGTSI